MRDKVGLFNFIGIYRTQIFKTKILNLKIMLIKNLPQPIKELVFKRQIEQGKEPNEELSLAEIESKGNFNWDSTHEGWDFWSQTNEADYRFFFEKYGGVILCTSFEQGAKIIEYFKSLRFDTVLDCCTIGKYCGLGRGKFGFFSRDSVLYHGLPIFTLDELGVQMAQEQPNLPEINFEGIEMEVWDDDEDNLYHKSKVIAKINGKYLIDDWTFWDNARPIPQKVKVTKEQIAEAFNTTVELLEIE